MTREDIVREIGERTGMSLRDVWFVIEEYENVILDAVRKKEPIKISGFLHITRKPRKSHPGYNFATGEMMTIEARDGLVLKAGSRLLESAGQKTKAIRSDATDDE